MNRNETCNQAKQKRIEFHRQGGRKGKTETSDLRLFCSNFIDW